MKYSIFIVQFEEKDLGWVIHSGRKIQNPEKYGIPEFLKVLMRQAIEIISGTFIPR
jgi:hypothetical protein